MYTSFCLKLTKWYFSVSVLMLVTFCAILYSSLSRTVFHDIDESLRFIAETEISSILDSPAGDLSIHEINPMVSSNRGLSDKYVQLLDLRGNVVSKSNNLGQKELPGSQRLVTSSLQGKVGFETVLFHNKKTLRLISLPVMDKGKITHIVVVGTSLLSSQRILYTLLQHLVVMGLGGLLVACFVGWLLTKLALKQALKPIVQITETAKAVSGQSLSKRLKLKNSPEEIGQLIEVFNDMMERLEQAFASQHCFIADASHEMRSPLTALKGTLEVLLRRKRTTEEYEQGISNCLEEMNRLIRMVNNLLILTQTDIGSEEMNFQEVRLDKLIQEVLELTKVLAQEKMIQLQYTIKDEINYHGDRDRLKQLVINLLDNAIRYTPKEGHVQLFLGKENGNIQITVADNGIGIPQNDIPYIFKRFYRVDRSSSQNELSGTGLGLAICQWIARAHRGKIEVDSTLGKGSVFTVLLANRPFR